MPLVDAIGLRAKSSAPFKSRWKPVDLTCTCDGEEFTVRTKLGRDPESVAVSIAESVSHAFLEACGFRVADAYAVTVSQEFAEDLSAQYAFVPPVRAGRHWGTRYMQKEVLEVEFVPGLLQELSKPEETFLLYLADAVLANPDRRTHGNVLLARRANEARFDLLPIDQSDAFFHPGTMRAEADLRGRFDRLGAQWLDGTELAVFQGGTPVVESSFDRIGALRDRVSDFVSEASGEWLDEARVDPELLVEFLEHRIDNLEALVDRKHWMNLPLAGGGGHVITLGI